MVLQLSLEAFGLSIFIALSAFFAASEVAFLSVSNVKIQSLLEKEVRGAKTLQQLRADRRRVVISLLIGGNIANVAASAIATTICVRLFGDTGIGIAVGVMSFLLLTLGDIAPKSAATSYGERIALFNAPLIRVWYTFSYPLVLFFEGINRLIPGVYSRPMNVERFTEDEIKSAVKLGLQSHSITEKEKQMIENVLAFNDRTVLDAMTPNSEVMSMPAAWTVSKAHDHAFRVAKHSRYPIVEDGKVVGVISVRKLGNLFYEKKDALLKDVALEAVRVQETDKASDAFAKLQTLGRNIAIVENSKGAYVGIITLEDLLEELVGEII